MFQWDKSVNGIGIPAREVLHLFRSMREVQLALPGVPAQQASAYLCQYQVEDGVATVTAFHLHKNQLLAFYFSDPRVVPEQKTDSMLDRALNFVESMGFLMTDQDIHLLDDADQEMLWASLPLKAGLAGVADGPVPSPAEKPTDKTVEKAPDKFGSESIEAGLAGSGKSPLKDTVSEAAPAKEPSFDLPEERPGKVDAAPPAVDNVDDLLAAVEAMRAKRPGLRARKTLPPKEERDRRRLQLRETIGRILASL